VYWWFWNTGGQIFSGTFSAQTPLKDAARSQMCALRKRVGPAKWQMAFLLLLGFPIGAAQPMISKIERYSSNQVLIHFDVQANSTCTLQWTDGVKSKSGSLIWSNLWVSPNLPFFEHYIIQDTRTKKQRFYRLQVSP
jgi:hypothetical protein